MHDGQCFLCLGVVHHKLLSGVLSQKGPGNLNAQQRTSEGGSKDPAEVNVKMSNLMKG